ncbi:MAG: TldD/PmbA family protein [Clostridia bacterium]|nr:TldD/PmbA family protein [Clostridia bacterium]
MDKERLQDIAHQAVQEALAAGAESAEAYLGLNRELEIIVRQQKVDTLKLAEESGLGLRVFKKQKTGFAFTSILEAANLTETAEQAMANASIAADNPYVFLPEPASHYPDFEQYDPAINQVSTESKIALAKELEAGVQDCRVKIIHEAGYTDIEEEIVLVNSRGVNLYSRGTYFGLSLALAAEENGDKQNGFALDYRTRYLDLNPVRVSQEAVRRAVRMLGAENGSGGEMPVILEPYVARGFLGLMAASLSAEAVQKGKSLLADKLGQKIASGLITLADDGLLAGGLASLPFDGEGTPMQRKILIREGILQQFLFNCYTAAKAKSQSTGNGVRASFKETPRVGTTNLFLEPGSLTLEQMMQGLEKGLLVTEIMGMHTANPVSGDFSVGASGLLIEKGRVVKPVRGLALAGNVLDLFAKVKAVGSDLTFYGSRGTPSLLIERLSVSGRQED